MGVYIIESPISNILQIDNNLYTIAILRIEVPIENEHHCDVNL